MLRRLTTLFVALLLAGCSSQKFLGKPVEAYVIGDYRFACQRWVPEEPPAEYGLFDVSFGQGSATLPGHRPSDEDRQRILSAGGMIVHEFHLRRVRAILPIAKVPNFHSVLAVGDPESFLAPVSFRIRMASAEEVLQILEEKGAVIRSVRRGSSLSVSGLVPDAQIAWVWRHEDTVYVEQDGVLCLD